MAQTALPMRGELSTRADAVAELKYGEKLEVLQVRRRFLKVRNMGGVEGWVDSRALLTTSETATFRETIELALKLPSQGSAIVFDAVNIHALPSRSSPSPFQIPAGGSVEITGHTVVDRVAYQPRILSELLPKAAPVARKPKKKKGKKGEDTSVEPPPMPAAPKLPEDWIELSKSDVPEDPEPPPPASKRDARKPRPEPSQVKADDWYLVRTPDKKAGWVLSRLMNVSIPDEVATYAEGRRITSYFSLGQVTDDEIEDEKKRVKHHWLWTTMSQGLRPFQFDGLRVFIYNTRRHRYETAYREREIKGFYPVLQHPVQIVENRKTLSAPGFTVFTEDEDGLFWRRTYALYGYRVRPAGAQRIEKLDDPLKPESILRRTEMPAAQQPPSVEKTIVDKVKKILKR